MGWIDRDVHLPISLLGVVVIASCTSASSSDVKCEYRNAQDEASTLLCIPLTQQTGGSPSTGTAGSGVSGGLQDIENPGGPGGMGGSPPLSAGGSSGSPVAQGGSVAAAGAAGNPVASGGSAVSQGGSVAVAGSSGGEPTTSGGVAGAPPVGGGILGRIQVNAGTLARDHTVVTFPLPDAVGKNVALKDAQGNQLALQVSRLDGNASFILPSLAAGQQATYTIEELPAAAPQAVKSAQEGQHLFVSIGDKKVFRWTLVEDNFRMAASRDVRKGYIYPLYTPSGLNVADDYAPDHPHMHGIWSAWTSTTFRNHPVDFWNGYANQGHVDLESMEGIWSGAVHAGLIANIKHTDITTNPRVDALKEKWVVTVYKTHDTTPGFFVFDIDSTQNTAGSDPLVLEQYHYGGFGFRGSEQWRTVGSVEYLTSEGHTRANGDGKTARWCAQYGNVDGKPAGYAALSHKDNPRHPQGLRIHPTNPYWSFTASTPASGGRLTISPGQPYRSRFRIVSFDGPADAALLNRLWDDYSTPPTVQVLPP